MISFAPLARPAGIPVRVVLLAVALSGAGPGRATAAQDLPADPFELAVRLGVAASSALLEDSVGPGADPVVATPEAGPSVGVSAALRVRPRLHVEVELGWSGVDLAADDGRASWTADELGVLHGALLARVHLARAVYGRAGVGLIRYAGEREGGFLVDDAQTHPYVTAGVGAEHPAGRFRLFAELNGQAHRFSFRDLRAAGGESGTVWRGLLQAGAAVPLGAGS